MPLLTVHYKDIKFKKDRILHIKHQIATNAKWALRALERIYDNQTEDEQSSYATTHHNKIGFTGCDASILTSYAKQYKRKGFLTIKQMQILHKKMPKYARQLDDIAQTLKEKKAA